MDRYSAASYEEQDGDDLSGQKMRRHFTVRQGEVEEKLAESSWTSWSRHVEEAVMYLRPVMRSSSSLLQSRQCRECRYGHCF